jgi:tRNA G10  N-methylase Trm11
MTIEDFWQDCYQDGWKGIITEASFAHPAKVSYSLAERIYHHLADEGWIAPGSRVLDPFGGIGGFALHAMLRGCHFTGCELEEKFVLLARENLARWTWHYRHWSGLGSAVMVQGDSRRLREVLAGQCAAVVSSPPFLDADNRGNRDRVNKLQEAVVKDGKGHNGKLGPSIGQDYGSTPGQLGAMKEGAFTAVVSSPPWENQEPSHAQGTGFQPAHEGGRRFVDSAYGKTPGNIGNSTGATFWSASKDIVQQCSDLLAPGGHAVWVVKAFVRKGKIVDFPGQWRQLCEAVGFVTRHEHRALLVEEREQETLWGGRETRKKERKSFFRRLHEKRNPATAIDYETVYCMEKR